ncbi:hypothetical protein F4806DRAFT_465144 [Annulohypoxylon nitens]|nr:hypothetical protein F4806DRAFT_465144 [Annulohypoxylon nitens]
MDGVRNQSALDAGQGEIGTPSSLSGQKRPRDYGEQLKGLPESDDEGVQVSGPSYALKKRKTDHSGNDNDSDLDDGEIVESDPAEPLNTLVPQDPQLAPQHRASSMEIDSASNAPAKIQAPEPSEDGEIDSNVVGDSDKTFFIDTTGTTGTSTMQHSSWNQGVNLRTKDPSQKSTTQPSSGGTSKAPNTLPSKSAPRIRGKKDKIQAQDVNDQDYDDPGDHGYQPPPSPEIDGNHGAPKPEPKPKLTFSFEGATWNLHRQSFKITTRNFDYQTFWTTRLPSWVSSLIEANEPVADRITVEVVKAGLMDHMNRKGMDGLFKGHGNSKQANKLRAVAEAVLEKIDLGALISKSQNNLQKRQTQASEGKMTRSKSTLTDKSTRKAANQNPSKKTQLATIQTEVVPTVSNRNYLEKFLDPKEELQLQQRYFPLATDPSIFCLRCSGVGHKANECPLIQCKFCGGDEHSMFACPTRRRCSKCRQLGHGAEVCNEKLRLAPEEQDQCAFCGGEHSDELCTEIWRAYKAVPGQQKKVKDIPIFCYTCGNHGHYGPECGLPDRGGKVTERTSWSQANRNLYVDPNSEDFALAYPHGVNDVPPPARSLDIRIRGTANKQVHTHFVSDDSDEELVHAPVQRQDPQKQIRISSNISSVGQGSNRGRGGRRNPDQSRRRQSEREFSPPPPPPPSFNFQGNGSWQHPLPPGPPPPPHNGYDRPLAPPPGSLPPRPPTYDSRPGRNDSSNRGGQNNRGGRGNRGGSRGNFRGGKGRGRGK